MSGDFSFGDPKGYDHICLSSARRPHIHSNWCIIGMLDLRESTAEAERSLSTPRPTLPVNFFFRLFITLNAISTFTELQSEVCLEVAPQILIQI